MARPKKQTVDYFPHYVNSGKTLFILEKNYGNDGYAFWFKVLELLGSTNGHIIDSRKPDEWEFLLAKTIVSDSLARDILDLLAKLNAIDQELWSKGIIWGTNFVDNVSDVYKNRKVGMPKKPDLNSFYEHKPEQGDVSTSRNHESSEFSAQPTNINSQSKVKQSKVNTQEFNQPTLDQIESVSESETLHNTQIKNKFKEYSDLYPKKTKKREAFEAFKLLTDDEIKRLMIGTQNMAIVAKNLTADDFKFLKNQATFITDNAYLDYQTVQSTATAGSEVPDWYDPEYKNETSTEQQAELEKIRLEALEKMN